MKKKSILLGCLLLGGMLMPVKGQQTQFEKLNRGVVAVKTAEGVYLSWRSLITDDAELAFDVYRDGVKVNETPVSKSTNYVDKDGTVNSRYVVKAVLTDAVTETSSEVSVWAEFYKKVHLQRPTGGTTADKIKSTYSPNDCSVGDVDGDGEYELIVKWDPNTSHDNSEKGYTGNVYLDCYKLDGTFKWRIDLGKNIRAGAHYTQFIVYDLDGDGKAEIACKTAPGTIDGQGKAVLMGADRADADYRNSNGHIITGSEYLTVFSGETGAELATVAYSPLRGAVKDWGKDDGGNRSERYLACVAYLDGKKPSLVMCRGYYARTALAAYDFDGINLTQRWIRDDKSSGSSSAYGQGNHNLSVGDVDGDGCDEIIYGACCIDHDGSLLYRTGLGHGDAIHLGDLDPDREGLEVFSPHEEPSVAYGYELHDARTGQIIFGRKTKSDIGRGIVADIDAAHRGYEMWIMGYDETSGTSVKINDVYDCKGNVISTKRPSVNFRIYWDGDLQDELFDGRAVSGEVSAYIQKWDGTRANQIENFTQYSNAWPCNTTKGTPNLVADIMGDWREEIILWDSGTSSDLLIFTTTIPTEHKVTTLMHDHVYRMGIVWQNVAYNQPPHLGYYLPDRDAVTAIFLNGSGALTQSLELGEAITPVTYSWKNADDVELNGSLPAGVLLNVDKSKQTFTIEGTPTTIGTFAYAVKTIGGETTATLTGTITVKPETVLTGLAYFPFDETSGNSASNQIYGQAEAVGFTPTWPEGKRGQALELPEAPVERRMQQASYDNLQLGTKSFSIELWFRSAETTAAVDWYLLHKGSHAANAETGATGKWFGVQYKNGKLTFGIDDNVTKSNLDVPASDYFDNVWNHLVCVRDRESKTLKMYINGVLQGEAADNTGDISEPELLVIGNCNVNFNTPFVGAIDELSIYEGAMNTSKVKQRYENPNVSGISDNRVNRTDFIVYPALFTDELTLECSAGQSGRATVTIYSAADGMSVHYGVYAIEAGAKIYLSGLSTLPAGSYIMAIESEGNRIVKKLLKAK